MLLLKNITLTLTKNLRVLVENFNFSLQQNMKVALIGEEGNGKSTLLKAIASPESLANYMKLEGEIVKSGEVIGYLPQILDHLTLEQTTVNYFRENVNQDFLDYNYYYKLLQVLNFPEDRISEKILLANLSGGEKIKFQLLCEMLKKPTVLLLDEPSNDLDIESVCWLEKFISDAKIPIMFVSHDETLLENSANTIVHLEQLMRKQRPQYTVAQMPYLEYVQNREVQISKQTQIAQKEREEFDAKMERYREIYQRVHHEQRIVSRQSPSVGKNLKDKMHSIKSMGRRFEKEEGRLAKRPDYEESISVRFESSTYIPRSKKILELEMDVLQIGERILSRNLYLHITGPEKVCIVGSNGAGKTTLLRHILKVLKIRKMPYGYMPQEYSEIMNQSENAIQFLTLTGTKKEHTRVRTYLGSMNFTAEEMLHPIQDLSGGQKAKLFFSKMILDQSEILILDEPTRNLSPLSGPEICLALKNFGGSIIAVSHDRKFIKEVFDRTLLLDGNGLRQIVVE